MASSQILFSQGDPTRPLPPENGTVLKGVTNFKEISNWVGIYNASTYGKCVIPKDHNNIYRAFVCSDVNCSWKAGVKRGVKRQYDPVTKTMRKVRSDWWCVFFLFSYPTYIY